MELIEKDNMITAWGTKDGVATVIGVDFGHKNDYAVKTVLKKHPDGRVEVVSSEPIGRTIDFICIDWISACLGVLQNVF